MLPSDGKGNRVFIYQDDFRKAEFYSRFTEKQEKEYGEVLLTDKDLLSNKRRGLFAFVSNLDCVPLSCIPRKTCRLGRDGHALEKRSE